MNLVNPLIAICSATDHHIAMNTVIGMLAIDGWAVTFGTARRGLGGAQVPITVLLYNDPLLCGFNVGIKGLKVGRL